MKILLASGSPRRKELLQNLGFSFEVVSVECDEVFPEDLATQNVAAFLSELKSNAFRTLKDNEVLVTADTIVVLENEVLGKPRDHDDAKQMLRKLSAKTHQVYTGITIRNNTKSFTRTDVAHVEFAEILDAEIEFYLNNYKPFDKAGSYGVQEWLGMAKILKITGSFYTVMGLPTHLLYSILKDFE